jgi:hypothetical protein
MMEAVLPLEFICANSAGFTLQLTGSPVNACAREKTTGSPFEMELVFVASKDELLVVVDPSFLHAKIKMENRRPKNGVETFFMDLSI